MWNLMVSQATGCYILSPRLLHTHGGIMFGNYACPHCINDYDVLKWPIKGVHKHAIHERDIMRNE
jgi:hypothetical protein